MRYYLRMKTLSTRLVFSLVTVSILGLLFVTQSQIQAQPVMTESKSVEIKLLALDANDDKYGYALPASGDSCPQVCTGTGKAQYCYTPSSCPPPCVSNQGSGCLGSPNSCGMRNSGTVQCNGSCSASTPSNSLCGGTCVSNQGSSCTSSSNSCGMTNSGTVQCNGSCSATTPSNSSCGPTCVSNQGNSCIGSSNSCGMTNSGTVQCNGSCSASTPSENLCYPPIPTISITAASYIVRSGTEVLIDWDPSGWDMVDGGCELQPAGYFSSANANSDSSRLVTVTAKTTFTYRCTADPGVYADDAVERFEMIQVEVLPSLQEV